MLKESTILYDYENLLLGRINYFEVCFKSGKKESYREIGVIWRYALENLMKWTAKEAEKNLSLELINMLCLDKTYCGLTGESKASTYIGDYKDILQYVFPDEIYYNAEEEAVKEYIKVSKLDEWKNDKNNYRYPKNFFKESDGIKRSEYLLRYAVNRYLGDLSASEKYKFFASSQAKDWIESKNLSNPLKLIYSSPLDFFHNSVFPTKRNYYLYYMYKIDEKSDILLKQGK